MRGHMNWPELFSQGVRSMSVGSFQNMFGVTIMLFLVFSALLEAFSAAAAASVHSPLLLSSATWPP